MSWQWWSIIVVLAFDVGVVIGGWWIGWRRYWLGVEKGRAAMAWEIEHASGMHEPVCTCVSTPGRCYWHGNMTEGIKPLAKDQTN